MEQAEFKVYSYRWIVLAVFMLVVAANQLLWITLNFWKISCMFLRNGRS